MLRQLQDTFAPAKCTYTEHRSIVEDCLLLFNLGASFASNLSLFLFVTARRKLERIG